MKTEGTANDTLAAHLENLKGIRDTQQRRDYIERVQVKEGKFVANWLKDEFAAWWWKEQKA